MSAENLIKQWQWAKHVYRTAKREFHRVNFGGGDTAMILHARQQREEARNAVIEAERAMMKWRSQS